VASRPGRPRGGGGAKRTQEDLEALSSQLAAFVKAKPSLRIEQINKELGTSTKARSTATITETVSRHSGAT